MENFYFTFGCGSDKARKYVKIVSTSRESARDLMFAHYGKAWGFQYDESGFEGQVDEFGLSELEVIREGI